MRSLRCPWYRALILTFLALVACALAAYADPVPLINQPLVPASAAPGGKGFTLTVNGTGFVHGAVVKWNGLALTTGYVSGSQLTASVSASNIDNPGTASVTVENPNGATSNMQFFTVSSPVAKFVTSQFDYPISTDIAIGIVIADFNHDGNQDVAVADGNPVGNGGVSVLLGNSDGTLQSTLHYRTGSETTSLVAGDFNRDGNPDLAAANNYDGTISVLLGNGDGAFQPQVVYNVGIRAAGLAAGDFNADGILDLAVCTTNNISVLLGNGDGTFQPPLGSQNLNLPERMTTADFNRDGKLDIAVGSFSQNAVLVLLGNGDGTFGPPASYATTDHTTVNDLAVADFNGDGILDIAAGSLYLNIFLGNGDGTFQPGVQYGTRILEPLGLSFGDFNADGILDIAAAGFAYPIPNQALLFFGNGDGTFQNEITFGKFTSAEWTAAGDFNNDGQLDLVVTDQTNVYLKKTNVDLFLQGSFIPTVDLQPGKVTLKTKVGNTASQVVTLSNTGNGPLLTRRVHLAGALEESGAFSYTSTCATILTPGASCTITIQFAPTLAARYTGHLVLNDNAGKGVQKVPVIGVGVP